MIIAITGNMGSGKNTWANMLQAELETRGQTVMQVAFAYPIKELAAQYFKWDGAKNRDSINTANENLLGGRTLLQGLGHMLREEVSENFWIHRMLRTLKKHPLGTYALITDCRYTNEARFIYMGGNKVIRITRKGVKAEFHPSESEQWSPEFERYVGRVIVNDTDLLALRETAKDYALHLLSK